MKTHTCKLLILVFFLLSMVSCGGGDDPPGDGLLVIQVQTESSEGTPAETMTSLRLNSNKIAVVHRTDRDDSETEQVLTVFEEPTKLEFLSLNVSTPTEMIRMYVPPGFVYQIRIFSTDIEAQFEDGRVEPVSLPSGDQTGLKLVPKVTGEPIEIRPNETSASRVLFDPAKQIVFNQGRGIIEKPTLSIVEVAVEDLLFIVPSQIIVAFKEGTTSTEIDAANADIDAFIIKKLSEEKLVYLIGLDVKMGVIDAYDYYSGLSIVGVATPNTFIYLDQQVQQNIPNDLNVNNPPEYAMPLINAPQEWVGNTGTRAIVVGILDSGIDVDHPDLINNIWLNVNELPVNVQNAVVDADNDGVITFADLNDPQNAGICPVANNPNGNNNICDPLDLVDGNANNNIGFEDGNDNDNNGFVDDLVGWDFVDNDNLPQDANNNFSHGAAVAGFIGAEGNNGIDTVGVNWVISMAPLRILGAQGTNALAVQALNYAAGQGFDVVNGSWGVWATGPNAQIPAVQQFPQCQRLIDGQMASDNKLNNFINQQQQLYATVNFGNMIYVTSAGNCPVDLDQNDIFKIPVEVGIGQIIAVANTDQNDNLNASSAFGQNAVHVSAPGTNVLGLAPAGNAPMVVSGTSFSAPIVSGVAALVLAGNPGVIGNQLINQLGQQNVFNVVNLQVAWGGRITF